MFSQYSWWDFIKFVLVLAVPYYAYVIWKYYREDIQEWISNRGEPSVPTTAASADEEDDSIDDSGLYAVKTYSDEPDASTPTISQKADPQPQVAPDPLPTKVASVANQTPDYQDVDLSEGVVIGDASKGTFELALIAEVIRPIERSLATVISAAQRITANEQGLLAATNSSDSEASEVASIINQQRGLASLLSGVQFNR